MVSMSISNLKTVKLMLNGKTGYAERKQRNRLLKRGNILYFYYVVAVEKCCENCIVKYLDIEYQDIPVNCPHAGVCKYYTNFIGSTKITGVLPIVNNLHRFRFNKIIQPDRQTNMNIRQEGTHGIRLTKV